MIIRGTGYKARDIGGGRGDEGRKVSRRMNNTFRADEAYVVMIVAKYDVNHVVAREYDRETHEDMCTVPNMRVLFSFGLC